MAHKKRLQLRILCLKKKGGSPQLRKKLPSNITFRNQKYLGKYFNMQWLNSKIMLQMFNLSSKYIFHKYFCLWKISNIHQSKHNSRMNSHVLFIQLQPLQLMASLVSSIPSSTSPCLILFGNTLYNFICKYFRMYL